MVAISRHDTPAREALIRKQDWRSIVVILALVALVEGVVLAADVYFGIDHYNLVRDPNAIANNPNYYGLLSNIGIILWSIAAISALQAWSIDRRATDPALGRALLAGGCFAALMGIDDFLMLHESIATIGVPEPLLLLPHILFLAMLCRNALLIRDFTPAPLLACAVVSFALSFAIDVTPISFGGQVFIEESFKLAGIAFLAAYLVAVSRIRLA